MRKTLVVLLGFSFVCCAPGVGGNGANGTSGSDGSAGGDGANGAAGATGLATLATIAAAGPSGSCTQGGVTLETGVDTNSNGTLDSSEVQSSQLVCNGASPQGQLTKVTPVISDSPECETRVRIDSGTDNGAAGGIAGDGILQTGEITATYYACASRPLFISDLTPPTGPSGLGVLDAFGGVANGATGTTGGSSKGGSVNISILDNSFGGQIKIFTTGTVTAAAWTMPTLSYIPGTQPRTISSSTTVVALTTTAALAAANGTYFTLSDQTHPGQLYQKVGGALVAITDLTIDADVTLNKNETVLGIFDFSYLRVPGAIVNNGVITASAGSSIVIDCSVFQSTNTINNPAAGVTIRTTGDLLQQGSITTSAVNGTTDLDGGAINLRSDQGTVYNALELKAFGAKHTGGGTGGKGGSITLSGARGVNNSGLLNSTGGSTSGEWYAGNGGTISLVVTGQDNGGLELTPPVLRNTGTIYSYGGPCETTKCQAGNGGAVVLDNHAGVTSLTPFVAIANSGYLSSFGGTADNGAATNESRGGAAGTVSILSSAQSGPGNVRGVAGSIHLSGGIGTYGGLSDTDTVGNSVALVGGGSVNVTIDPGVPNGQEIIFYGMKRIGAKGGNTYTAGTNRAGDGGTITISNGRHGGIVNYAKLEAQGGDTTLDGTSGNGGSIVLSAGGLTRTPTAGEQVNNYGDINLNGGLNYTTSNSYGGYGGTFRFVAASDIFSMSNIYAGAYSTDRAVMPPLQTSSMYSGGGTVTITAKTIALTGGNAARGNAGPGGNLDVIGRKVVCFGASNIYATGGNATAPAAGGGDGGHLTFMSNEPVSQLSGTMVVGAGTRGASGPTGVTGTISKDGVNLPQ